MTIDKQALRQLATDAHELGIIKRYTKGIEANKRFIAAANPATVLALLNELEAAESKCRELAAENSQMLRLLTDISENHDEYVNADEYLYAGVPMDYVSEINAYVSRDVDAANPFKTTDAFLAEVRAQGVEMFVAHCQKRHGEMLKTEPNEPVSNEAITATRRAGEFALYFAVQLREGAAL